jgi:hypothetical protein
LMSCIIEIEVPNTTLLGKIFEVLSRNKFHGQILVLSCSGSTI